MAALAACACLAPLAGEAVAAPAQKKAVSHRSQRMGMFALSKIESAPVVMLGDSLTEGGLWGEITGCMPLANRGIGGDDSEGLLKRLDDVIRLKPNAVFLMIGVNDVNSGVSTSDIVDNVQEILGKLKKTGAKIYLQLVLPVAESFPRKLNPKIDELNKAYLKLAKAQQVQIVDFRADMRNSEGFLKDEYSRDGIHLTIEGFRAWRDAILPLVQQHCGPMPPVAAPKATPPRRTRVNEIPAAPTDTAPAAMPTGEFNTRFGPWR